MNRYAELVPTSSTRRFAAAALCAGALAAIALPGNRLGLGMVLVAWLAIAAVAISGTLPRSRYTALLAGLSAAALAAMAALRDASWLLWVDLIAAAVVVVAAAVDARTWPALVRSQFTWARKLLPALPAVAWFSGVRPRAETRRRATPVLRGLVLGWVLVLVFGALFASADEAFAQLTDGVLTPDVDLGLLPRARGRGARDRGGLRRGGAGRAGAHRREAAPRGHEGARVGRVGDRAWPAERRCSPPSWLCSCGCCSAARTTCCDTAGVTYADYAREGFYQLLAWPSWCSRWWPWPAGGAASGTGGGRRRSSCCWACCACSRWWCWPPRCAASACWRTPTASR